MQHAGPWRSILRCFAIVVLGYGLTAFGATRKPMAPNEVPQEILQRASEFLELNRGTTEFEGKKILGAQPIYAYGVKGIAYYEVWLTVDGQTPRGWMLLSATDMDYALVNFSHDGTPYSQKVMDRAEQAGVRPNHAARVYRFGVSFFSLEDGKGNFLASFGQLPETLLKNTDASGSGNGDSTRGVLSETGADQKLVEGVHFDRVRNYDELRRLFPASYFSEQRKQTALKSQGWIAQALQHKSYQPLNQYNYRWIYNDWNQAYYTQIPAYTGWNNTACWSGCSNNAWMNIYGWWDLNMGKAGLVPTTSTGEASPAYRNTVPRQNSVDPNMMWIRNVSFTYCSNGAGATNVSDVYRGFQYASAKGYGYNYWYQWCNSGGCNVNLADIVTDGIANNGTPVHVGAFSHAYVGWGWAQFDTNTDWTWVYGYPGWSENHNDDVWIWWHDFVASTRMFVY